MEQGKKQKKPIFKRWWFWLIVALLVIGAVGSVTGGDKGKEDVTPPPPEMEQMEQPSPNESEEPSPQPEDDAPEAEDSFVLDVASLTDADIGALDTGDLTLTFGELMGVNYGGNGVIVVKGKISAQISDRLTISQNYYSIHELIKERGFDTCQELQYWAVSDMSDGSEAKVISFTLDRVAIEGVADGSILENQLGDHVSDLYIHPSLQK